MNIFEQIMAPFIFIIEQILLFSYELTGNYGVSIILLSLAISLLLLPVFIFIEKSKKKDDVVKKKMQPLIDEIKRVYKGQERYYYIKTVNRQHNYSSFKALIPILSLLLQIPFFIAAYQFLENFEPLQQISFGFIPDLSQADGFFGEVNILPIIMTLVNLITVYYYTRNGDTSERRQMLVLAIAFLVLLFNLPSGLVLYWTMNNVFSFFRLFITNPEVFKNKNTNSLQAMKSRFFEVFPKVKVVFIVILITSLASQFYWAFEHNFDDIFLRIGASIFISIILSVIAGLSLIIYNKRHSLFPKIVVQPQIFFSLFFLTIYFYLASQFYFTGENITLGILAILFLIPIQLIGFLYTSRYLKATKKNIKKSIYIVLSILFSYQLSLIYSYFIDDEISLSLAKLKIQISPSTLSDIFPLGITLLIIVLFFYLKQQSFKHIKSGRSLWIMLLLSVSYMFGLIFFWNPLIVYSSFPADFDFPAFKFLTNNFLPFIISFSAIILLFLIVPKKIKYLVPQVFLSLVVVVLLYSSIIPFDVGTLQVNFFSNENNLAAETYFYILEGFLLIGVFIGISKVFQTKYFKKIIYLLIILNVFVIGQSLYQSLNTGLFFYLEKAEDHSENNGKLKEIQFSKNKENVVFFIVDAAQGWFTKDILDENPELKSILDGFVWYPNTISTSNFTYASVPAMMCGEDFTIANMNKDESTTISEKVTNSTNQFYNKIKAEGYYLTAHHLKYAMSKPKQIDQYLPKWDNSWSKLVDVSDHKSLWFSQLWQNALFSSMPLFLKPWIYNHNKWIESINDMGGKPISSTLLLNKYTFIKILPEISKSDSDQSNFIFIHSMFTHAPWDLITEDNKLISDVSPYESQKQFMELFSKWVLWMKANNVYDNTKIILVSDHGQSWWHHQTKINTHNMPLIESKEHTVYLTQFLRLSPLMLVKDFNAKGSVKEDWRLMTNMDTYAIAFDENDPTKKDSSSRVVHTYFTKWHTDLHIRKQYHNNLAFEIKDYVFDLNNWKSLNIINKNDSLSVYVSEIDLNDTTLVDNNYIQKERVKIISRIKKNYNWFETIKKQAHKREISVDSMLIRTADYLIETKKGGETKERAVEISRIKNDSKEYGEIVKKAKAQNMNVDSLIVISAINNINERKK